MMTAQTPERIIIDGRPRALYEQPLYPLLASRRMDLIANSSGFSTACHRRYLGTWEIRKRTLYLLHLNMMVPDEEPISPTVRQRLFRAVPCTGFPIKADWFNGRLRIAIGRLERQHKRYPEMRDLLDGTDTPEQHGMPGPLVWFDDSDEDWTADWCSPDYRPAAGL